MSLSWTKKNQQGFISEFCGIRKELLLFFSGMSLEKERPMLFPVWFCDLSSMYFVNPCNLPKRTNIKLTKHRWSFYTVPCAIEEVKLYIICFVFSHFFT